MANMIPAPHPGETIREDVLEPLGMSANQLAKALGITATRLNDVVRGRRGITADTALRLARYLGTSAEFWLGLQLEYDLRIARQTRSRAIEKSVHPRPAAAYAAHAGPAGYGVPFPSIALAAANLTVWLAVGRHRPTPLSGPAAGRQGPA